MQRQFIAHQVAGKSADAPPVIILNGFCAFTENRLETASNCKRNQQQQDNCDNAYGSKHDIFQPVAGLLLIDDQQQVKQLQPR